MSDIVLGTCYIHVLESRINHNEKISIGNGPRIDPCGTLYKNSCHELYAHLLLPFSLNLQRTVYDILVTSFQNQIHDV